MIACVFKYRLYFCDRNRCKKLDYDIRKYNKIRGIMKTSLVINLYQGYCFLELELRLWKYINIFLDRTNG
jgi:hypothetical protein